MRQMQTRRLLQMNVKSFPSLALSSFLSSKVQNLRISPPANITYPAKKLNLPIGGAGSRSASNKQNGKN